MLQRLEEETNVLMYIVNQKLPKEIESKRKEVQTLQLVASEPAMGRGDLESLKEKVILFIHSIYIIFVQKLFMYPLLKFLLFRLRL